MMKEKLRYYLIASAIVLCAIVVLLVVFLLPKENNNDSPQSFILSTQDIEMNVGESKTDFVEVSTNDVIITYSLSEEGVVEIKEDTIYAISAGSVTVDVTAKKGDYIVTDSFKVTVVAEEYIVTLSPVRDCSFSNDTLYIRGTSCAFTIALRSPEGETITSPLTFETPDGVSITHKFTQYILTADKNCEIKLIYQTINFEKSINVVIE